MGRVLSVEKNSLGEVTAARIRKGDTREIVYRHSTTLIPLLNDLNYSTVTANNVGRDLDTSLPQVAAKRRSTRNAAALCNKKLNKLALEDNM